MTIDIHITMLMNIRIQSINTEEEAGVEKVTDTEEEEKVEEQNLELE